MIREFLAIILAVTGALAFSQVPRYVQEYEQRLGGAVAEAALAVRQDEQAAAEAGVPLDVLRTQLVASREVGVAAAGRAIGRRVDRLAYLRDHQAALTAAGPITRPFVLLSQADPELATDTFAQFTRWLAPVFDVYWGFVGLVLGWLASHLHRLIPHRRGAISRRP